MIIRRTGQTLSSRAGLFITATALLVGPFTGVARAQSASLTPTFEPETSWTYDATLDVVVSQGPAGGDDAERIAEATRVSRVVQGARLQLKCIEVESDGDAIIRGALDRLTTLWTDEEGEQFEFTWLRANDPDIETARSPHEGLTRLSRALAGATFQITIGADGRVRSLTGIEQPMQVLAENEDAQLTMLGMFTPAQLPDVFSSLWRTGRGAPDSVEPGVGWQEVRTTPMGPAGAIEFIIDWTVGSVTEDRVTAAGAESVEQMVPESPDPAAPSVRILQHAGEHTFEWSRAGGCVNRRGVQRRLATEWTVGDAAIRQTQTSNLRINRAR